MDNDSPVSSPSREGLLESVRRMLATLLTMAQTRLELVTTEISEELNSIALILLWSLVAIFFAGLAVLALGALVVIALWDSYRLWAAGGVVIVFAVIAAFSLWRVRSTIASRPRLLSATIAELRRDSEALGGGR